PLRRLPLRPPPPSTLFPYTTLFRSPYRAQGLLPRPPARLPNPTTRRPSVTSWPAASSSSRKSSSRRPTSSTPRSRSRRIRSCCRSEEHTSELQSRGHLVCRLLLEKK